MSHNFGIRIILVLLLLAWICTATSALGDSKDTETKIIRNIAYHQITSTSDDISCHNGAKPMISDNGERAVFFANSQDGLAHIYVMKTDGSESPRDVYSFKTPMGDMLVAISPDGTKAAASEGYATNSNTIFFADIISGKTNKFSLEGNVGSISITNDGQVYFIVWSDNGIPGSNPYITVKRGLWKINFDGSGLTQIAGPDKIAALLGVSADSVAPDNGVDIGVSSDGSRIVFPAKSEKGKHILGINSEGTGLREYAFPKDYIGFISNIGISGDGSKIFYMIQPLPSGTPQETGVINFDGTDSHALIKGPGPNQDQDCGHLSYDGSILLVGREQGRLVDTKTGAKLQLTVLGGWDSSDPALVGDGVYLPSMDGSATKFLYLFKDSKGKWQLAVGEMNPSSLGEAPSITNPKIQPSFILTKEESAANVSASVTSSNALVAVGTDFLLNGLRDESRAGIVSLKDDGKDGDLISGDGIFSGVIEGNRDIPIGPRIVRLKAEVKGSDGKRHATALDLWPFAVAEGKDQATGLVNTPPPVWPPTVRPPTSPPPAPPLPPTPPTPGGGSKIINLTGIWSCNDGGTYYIRQIGDAVWWDGDDTSANPHWANVACGTISGNTVTLEYADVPEGTAIGYGTLVLEVISNDELQAKDKPTSYAGSHWVRSGIKPQPPINPTVIPPVSQPPVNQPIVTSPWNDPSIRQLIDEWILQQDKCVKKVYSGAYIDRWGRICGNTGTTTLICDLTPDHPADWDSYHYLWFNNPCPEYYPYRVQAYAGYRQSGSSFDSLAGCKGESDSCKA